MKKTRPCFPSPLVGEGGSTARSDGEPDEGSLSAERTPHPPCLRQGTFSHKGRREENAQLTDKSFPIQMPAQEHRARRIAWRATNRKPTIATCSWSAPAAPGCRRRLPR